MGQLLCIPMLLAGIALVVQARRSPPMPDRPAP
jgi:prolipoprotein diacylglyceryltransferase